jgi:hypothetical protein
MPHQKAVAKPTSSQRRRHGWPPRRKSFFQESQKGESRMTIELMIGYSG